ncbi:MAG: serine hydrolase [Oscillospiraceae bacterium]|nr:serine hydrolase [Oscillospiraceae bacterium]
MLKGKKFLYALILSFIVAGMLAAGAVPAGAAFNTLLKDVPKLSGVSEVLYLISLDDGSVVFNQNENQRCAPASLTKVVTAILVLEHSRDLAEKVEAKAYCIRMFDGTGSSNAGIKPGELLTVEELLYCMLLPSANEASAILADYVTGDIPQFVAQMNALAQRLGCTDTHFANPHGLDEEGHYTTAADMARILQYALSGAFPGNAVFEKITGTFRYEIPETNMSKKRNLISTNRMMNSGYADYYSKDVAGIKTGSTSQAGECVAARATRNGYHYLGIVMRGQKVKLKPSDPMEKNTAFVDCKAVLDWAFSHIRLREIAAKDQVVWTVPVTMARSHDQLQLVPNQALSALVPEGVDSGSVLIEPVFEELPASVEAPVKEGEVIVRAQAKFAGEVFAELELVAAESISRSASMYFIALAKQAVRHPIFQLLLAAVILVALIYLGTIWWQGRKKRQEKQMRVLPDIKLK